MIKITNQGNSITENEILVLENELGYKLPNSYRQFLIINNGGRPKSDIVDIEGLPGSPTDIQIFFGLTRNIESSNILWNLSIITERCPQCHVLPIACDSGGNIFCLKITNGIASKILYYDMDSSNCKFYEVAPSFDEFIKIIR